MSTLKVPYANGMRLGQGFNTYTQSICLDNAVRFDLSESSSPLTDAPKGPVPQTAKYTSRLVNKMSDVVDTMNLSAALSIRLGGVTAAGTGEYFSEDKVSERSGSSQNTDML